MDSSGYEIRIASEEKGYGLFVRKAYKEGDIIFEEKPLVCCQFAWNANYKYLACDYCLRPLESAEENARRLTGKNDLILPFPECCETEKDLITECEDCGTKFCGIECQMDAWDRYHKSLCLQTRQINERHPLIQLQETWKQMHYPPETATIMLLARMVAMVNQASEKQSIISIFSEFCNRTTNDTQEITHNLLGEKFIGQIDVLRQMMQKALNTESVPKWFTPDGFQGLLALVGTNGQGIGTSAFSRWVKNVSALELPNDQRIQVDKNIDRIYDEMDEVVGTFLNCEGSGLYITQSKLNHSCVPNATVEFPYSNNILTIRAARDIKPQEEICITYLDECQLERSRHSRQKALSSLYLFSCKCAKCEEQVCDPDITSDEDDDEDI
ncbi:PREDICTED: SET and MYND domain-containing protein 5 [Ceratosolen solmsi marchali]|uniref:Protein-lysine N-trimethyltransferase SMYD5 n=1 Tax=Ceratosolen solmsi marchali TaxID=326594 RepID=A0AAJ7DTK6_9HYME|nr:PREDICTED: SET and MYND domain-containing protein 5 [Ceratosolen solmsi marchali]